MDVECKSLRRRTPENSPAVGPAGFGAGTARAEKGSGLWAV